MKTCLILGSSSDLGEAIAYRFAEKGFDIVLAARSTEGYQERLKEDLSIRFKVSVSSLAFDGTDYETHEAFWDGFDTLPDVVVSTFGYLGSQERALDDFEEARKIIEANYTGHVSLLNGFAKRVKDRKQATIIGVSSVAGERGRQSNFIYGSAKAAFTAYLSGLRNHLFHHGIHVMSVLPGFMKTKMIDGIATPRILTAEPDYASRRIYKAYTRKSDIVYIYPVWKYIMLVIRNIPETVFKRMKL
jgi:decaprenylphospho-beta-D-erythro-pentofuranosid-2-ulose 2-reductase